MTKIKIKIPPKNVFVCILKFISLKYNFFIDKKYKVC